MEPGDRVVVLRLDEDGVILGLDEVPQRGRGISVRDETFLAVVHLPASHFAAGDGTPLPLEELVLHAGQSTGSCGRCQVPAALPPQLVFSGDDCALPPWLEVRLFSAGDVPRKVVSPQLEARVRSALRLASPGACACPLVKNSPPALLETCTPERAPPAFVAQRLAVRADGTALALSQGHLAWIEPEGTIHTRALVPALRELKTLVPAGGGFAATVRPLLAASTAPRLLSIERDLGLTGVDSPELSGIADAMLSAIDGSPWIQVLGRDPLRQLPAAAECRFDGAAPQCRTVEVERRDACPYASERYPLETAAGFDGGDLIAVTERGRLFFRPSGVNRYLCSPESGLAAPEQAGVSLVRSVKLLSIGRRLFFCGSSVEGAHLWSAELPPLSTLSDETLAPIDLSLELIARLGDDLFAVCERLVHHPLRPDHVLAQLGDARSSRVLQLDARGAIVTEHSGLTSGPAPLFAGGAPPLLHLAVDRSRASIAADVYGGLHRIEASSLERMAPERALDRRFVRAVAGRDDGVYAFFADGGIVRFAAGAASCAALELETIAPPAPQPPWDRVGAVIATADGWELVVTSSGAQRLERRSKDGALLETTALELPENGRVVQLERLPSGARVFLDHLGRLHTDASGGVEELPPIFDDPATPELEAAPPEPPKWDALGGALGALWAGGTDQLARVVASGPGTLRLEAFWRRRLGPAAFDRLPRNAPGRLGAIGARCPDDVALVSQEDLQLRAESSGSITTAAWMIEPGTQEPSLIELPGFLRQDDATALLDERPAAVIPSSRGWLLLYGGGDYGSPTLHLPGAPRMALPLAQAEGAARGGDLIAVHGRGAVVILLDR